MMRGREPTRPMGAEPDQEEEYLPMGRPSHVPQSSQRRQVEAMAGYGVPEIDIARVLGIDPKTLRKHYRDALDTGHVLANAKVAESLFRKATGDGRQSVTAAIFWLKTRAGWTETSRHEVHAATASDRFAAMSDQELQDATDDFLKRIVRLGDEVTDGTTNLLP